MWQVNSQCGACAKFVLTAVRCMPRSASLWDPCTSHLPLRMQRVPSAAACAGRPAQKGAEPDLAAWRACMRACRNSARLGQSLRIPFRDDYIALHISLIFSIIAATSMRAAEILVCGFYPGLPRFAILRSLLAWVRPEWTPCCSLVAYPGNPPVKHPGSVLNQHAMLVSAPCWFRSDTARCDCLQVLDEHF